MNVLGLITARGGSKGVPRKNIRPLCGRPLLAYTAESALQATTLTRVVLSTDDEEVAAIGISVGLCVPFERPAELAKDSTPSLAVVRHALLALEQLGEFYDAVCLLQPTNPLRRPEDIDACVDFWIATKADCVVSVMPVPHEFNPNWVFWMTSDGRMSPSSGENEPVARRQDLPPAFHRDGSVYVSSRDMIINRNTLYGQDIRGFQIQREFSANIDTEDDWQAVERRMVAKLAVEVGTQVVYT
ncbi:MAG: acylneuraminate cytidylyltransferase family protein [Pyrinomonadaceae bacterium]